jgi:hypothetical protein
MQKSKIKRDLPPSGRRLPFVMMSMLIAVFAILMESGFSATKPYSYLTRQQVEIAVFVMRLFPTLLQVVLIERLLKCSMRGWLVSTAIAAFVTLIILGTAMNWSDNLGIIQLVGTLTVFAPVMVFQTFWLWRRFYKAWYWPLIIVLAQYIVPSILVSFGRSSTIGSIFTVLPLMIAAVEASVLYHILSHPKDTEKAKVDAAAHHDAHANHLEQFERLERLQKREHETPLWDDSDHPALQSEA